MRKLIIALSAVAAIGLALPVLTGAAQAETTKVVIKKGDRGHHYGWRNHRAEVVEGNHGHHYGWRNHRSTKVVIKKHDRD